MRVRARWTIWLALAGRGWGKTRVGAELVRDIAERAVTPQMRLVGPTAADIRDTMVLGPAGIMATADPHFRPRYMPSHARLEWPNGVRAHLRSADEPERLRGGEYGFEWWDEVCAFRDPQLAMDTALPGLRMRSRYQDEMSGRWQQWEPAMCWTTTPKPIPVIKELLLDPTCYVTKGSTYENLGNLASTFRERIISRYEGTTVGRQELLAEVLDDIEGAQFTHRLINQYRLPPDEVIARKYMREVVVGVDPATTAKKTSDETGLVVAGTGQCPERFRWLQLESGEIVRKTEWERELHGFVLEDASGKYSPEGWANKALHLYQKWEANYIVAEVNQGGDMVAHIIQQKAPHVPVLVVHASVGKYARAEPIAMLYEQGKAHHVGGFGKLEDQMATFTREAKWSPDRMDALVWAFSYLFQIGSTPVIPAAAAGPAGPSSWVPA